MVVVVGLVGVGVGRCGVWGVVVIVVGFGLV